MVRDQTRLVIALINLIKHQRPDINKIYFYAKDPFELTYQLLFSEREKVEIKKLKIKKHLLIIHKQLMMSIIQEDYNVKTFFEIEVKKKRFFIVKQFLDNECSITLEK